MRFLCNAMAAAFLIVGCVAWSPPARAGQTVDLFFSPAAATAQPNDVIEIELVASAAEAGTATISAVDALLTWDPQYVELVEFVNPPGVWLVAGFLPDPDGINTDTTDGEALFTALAPPTELPTLPPDLVITRFRFRALANTPSTVVRLIPSAGQFARTRVLGEGIQNDVTGDITGAATDIAIGVPLPAMSERGAATLAAAISAAAVLLLRVRRGRESEMTAR